MTFLSKIQLIRRRRSNQWCVNVPAALGRALDLQKGETVEFRIVDKGTIILTRPNVPPDPVELAGCPGPSSVLPETSSATDPEETAEDVFSVLSTQRIEDAWDQAGASRYGYTPLDEVVSDMVATELDPFFDALTECRQNSQIAEGEALCCGIVLGLYRFRKSESPFAELAVDDCLLVAKRIVGEWAEAFPGSRESMNAFFEEHCPEWHWSLSRRWKQ